MKVEVQLKNFTPVLDCLTDKYDLITAAVYGAVWRYAQQEDRECYASLETIAKRAGTSRKTVERKVKKLCEEGYLVDLTPDLKHAPHHYACTEKIDLMGLIEPVTGKSESPTSDSGGKSESLTRSDSESYQGKSESLTKKQDKKDSKKEKDSSANADYSSPVSQLTEKEVKDLKLTLTQWKQYLEDEKVERQRKGVIKFIEGKVEKGVLLPDTPACKLLFRKLAIEADAKSRRPPEIFPTLACKKKFIQASEKLNGTLEKAIVSGLELGITSIPKLVNYVSSPKWQEGDKGNERSNDKKTDHSGHYSSQTGRNGAKRNTDGSGMPTPSLNAALKLQKRLKEEQQATKLAQSG